MNKQQREDLLAYAKPGDIIYFNGGDWTSKLVKFGQNQLDKSWTNELTHVVFVDKDNNISESTIEFKVEEIKDEEDKNSVMKVISGVKITPINEWAKDDGVRWPWLLVQRFKGITPEILDKATMSGQVMKNRGFFYPVQELVGTLIAYTNYNFAGLFKWINKKGVEKWQQNILKQYNPLNNKHAMYCITYVHTCFADAGFKILPDEINDSISNLGDGMRRKDKSYILKFISHLGIKDYTKKEGKDFDPDCIKDYKLSEII